LPPAPSAPSCHKGAWIAQHVYCTKGPPHDWTCPGCYRRNSNWTVGSIVCVCGLKVDLEVFTPPGDEQPPAPVEGVKPLLEEFNPEHDR
jgi:hypothetical protein